MTKKRSFYLPVLVVAVSAATALWAIWLLWGMHWARSAIAHMLPAQAASAIQGGDAFTQLGQAGDSFGAVNALFAALAGAAVLWAGYVQAKTVHQAQDAQERAEAAYDDERQAREKQALESTLFQMLNLTRDLTNSINAVRGSEETVVPDKRSGSPALDSLAWSLYSFIGTHPGGALDQACKLAMAYEVIIYDEQPSRLGPYFRLLYQMFKFIDESNFDRTTKARYANIVRGQISDAAVFLLAANGMTEKGHKFIRYIQTYGLLEHMHTKYRTRFDPALKLAYRGTAFLGSEGRANHKDRDEITALHEEDYFVHDQNMRETMETTKELNNRLAQQLKAMRDN